MTGFDRSLFFNISTGCRAHQLRRNGAKVKTAPNTVAAIPPINSHNVLFVGEPLKVRDKLEAVE
jgi:hypothetical protein